MRRTVKRIKAVIEDRVNCECHWRKSHFKLLGEKSPSDQWRMIDKREFLMKTSERRWSRKRGWCKSRRVGSGGKRNGLLWADCAAREMLDETDALGSEWALPVILTSLPFFLFPVANYLFFTTSSCMKTSHLK